MRPQQQNRRSRGRGNNRKSPNPLTRNYESNGPDVKIRGSAQQVADKYAALARDAQSSGDRVAAENYLQHAEHYNRIILAAQAQQQALREEREAEMQARENRESDDQEDQTEENRGRRPRNQSNKRDNDAGDTPQPVIDGTPAEMAIEEQAADEKPRRRRAPRSKTEDASGDEASPPKRTRKRKPEAEAASEEDAANGLAATLSRGSDNDSEAPLAAAGE